MKRSLVLAVLLVSCQGQSSGGGARGPVQQGRALLEQGQLDAALAKLAQAPADPDSLYYQGVIWAKKASAAPAPTPPPPESPAARGAAPPAPEFKPEELQALGLYEKAIAARPTHSSAHLGIAELLAPHAIRRHQREEEARKGKRGQAARRGAASPPPDETDFSIERVLGEYQKAQEGVASKVASETLIRFAAAVGRLDVAQAAHEALIAQDKADPQLLIRYGDFLAREKKDPEAAIDKYETALVWHPEDVATKAKIVDLYIAIGEEHYAKQEYGLADARFHAAEKYVTDRESAQARRLQADQARLRQIRPGP